MTSNITSPRPKARRPEGSIIEKGGNTLVRLYVGRDAAGKKVEWHHTVSGTDIRAKARAGRLLKELLRRKAATGGQVHHVEGLKVAQRKTRWRPLVEAKRRWRAAGGHAIEQRLVDRHVPRTRRGRVGQQTPGGVRR